MNTKRYNKLMKIYSGLNVKAEVGTELNLEQILKNIIKFINIYGQSKDLKDAKELLEYVKLLDGKIRETIMEDQAASYLVKHNPKRIIENTARPSDSQNFVPVPLERQVEESRPIRPFKRQK